MSQKHLSAPPMVDRTDFRTALSQFATGVTVITLANAGVPHGLTVNAFSAVSLEPPLVLFCRKPPANPAESLGIGDVFVVNILSAAQEQLALSFANPRKDSAARFSGVGPTLSAYGVPILPDTLGHLICRLKNHYLEGDHLICVGEVDGLSVNNCASPPLVYFQSSFGVPTPR